MKNTGALARAIESGFIPRKLCPNGHDLAVHGYDWNHSLRCKLCKSQQKQTHSKLNRKGSKWLPV